MDSPSPPQAPDPVATANAQGAANLEAARLTTQLGRPDQITPFGTLKWSQGPSERVFDQAAWDAAVAAQSKVGANGGVTDGWRNYGHGEDANLSFGWATGGQPTTTSASAIPLDRNDERFWKTTPSDKWTSTMELDPKVQAVVDAQLKTSLGLSGAIDKGLANVNSMMDSRLDYNSPDIIAAKKAVEDALYQQYTSRLDPRFQQEENKLRSDLMNRGIVEGSEAWRTQLDAFNRGKTDAYSTAQRDSVVGGGQEQNRLTQLQLLGRNQILNELASLRSGQTAPMPQFSGQGGVAGGQVQAAPIAQAMQNAYQGQMGAYNADVASNNSTMGTVGSIAAAAVMAF